jgi:hypothetical protein
VQRLEASVRISIVFVGSRLTLNIGEVDVGASLDLRHCREHISHVRLGIPVKAMNEDNSTLYVGRFETIVRRLSEGRIVDDRGILVALVDDIEVGELCPWHGRHVVLNNTTNKLLCRGRSDHKM